MKKSAALEKLLAQLAQETIANKHVKEGIKAARKANKAYKCEKYIQMEKRLHDKDVKQAVKRRDWVYVVNAIEGYLDGKDSGKWGKIFEIVTKLYLIGYRGNSCIISPQGNVDVIFMGRKIEIKTNCGYIEDMRRSALVIYTMDNRNMVYSPEKATIFMAGDFWDMLEELGLKRMRADRNGVERLAIQSYNNSKKKTRLLTEALAKQATVEEFKASVRIESESEFLERVDK